MSLSALEQDIVDIVVLSPECRSELVTMVGLEFGADLPQIDQALERLVASGHIEIAEGYNPNHPGEVDWTVTALGRRSSTPPDPAEMERRRAEIADGLLRGLAISPGAAGEMARRLELADEPVFATRIEVDEALRWLEKRGAVRRDVGSDATPPVWCAAKGR